MEVEELNAAGLENSSVVSTHLISAVHLSSKSPLYSSESPLQIGGFPKLRGDPSVPQRNLPKKWGNVKTSPCRNPNDFIQFPGITSYQGDFA
jgi:hypothetical protein